MNIRGYASATDPGRRRRQNEDSYVVLATIIRAPS